MSFSTPRTLFSIHTVLPYSRSTGLPYGLLRVVQGGELALSAKQIDLYGGSSRYPWASELGDFDSTFKFSCSEYPDFVFQLFLGASVTQTNAEASGYVSALANFTGTSIMNASTGCTSVLTSTTPADFKYGRYFIVYASATTVDVYAHSNIDATKGADLTTYTDLMKITSSPLTVPSGSTVLIPNLGITINGGSGTIAFTSGDSAYFTVRPIHTGRSLITVGQAAASFTAFGARLSAVKKSTGEIFEVNAFKCVGNGMPIGLKRNTWAEPSLEMKLLHDDTQDAVFEIEAIVGT